MSLICVYTDLRWNLIFDKVTLPMALLGLIYAAATGRIALALLGAAIGFGVFLIGVLRGQAGAGDAKMAGALGAWLGLGVLPVIIIACAIGLVWSSARSRKGSQLKPRMPFSTLPEDGTVSKALPFGVCLAAGAWIWITLLSVWQPSFMTIWRL